MQVCSMADALQDIDDRIRALGNPRYTIETFVGAKFGGWIRFSGRGDWLEDAALAKDEIASAEHRDGLVMMKRRVVRV